MQTFHLPGRTVAILKRKSRVNLSQVWCDFIHRLPDNAVARELLMSNWRRYGCP